MPPSLSTVLDSRSPFLFPAIALSALGLSAYLLVNRAPSILPSSIPSPRTLLPSLSQQELAALPYPPNFYPGGRWVNTPHGTTRAYEFGPDSGKKVLLVHGISTPCVIFRDFVWKLVEEGHCRVLLFDLYGRGYSDSPLHVTFDAALYHSQILHVLLSSPLPWLSPGSSFSIIGYSLGGCLIPPFLTSLPSNQLSSISSVVLLCSAGLLQSSKMPILIKLGYKGYLPTALQTAVARRIIRKGVKEFSADNTDRAKILDLDAIAGWQAMTHKGFLHAWMGSSRSCPIFDSFETWAKFRGLLESGAFGAEEDRIEKGRVLIVMALKDETVRYAEVAPGIIATLHPHGCEEAEKEGLVKWKIFEDDGHDVVVKKGGEVADAVLEFWGLTGGSEMPEDVTSSWVAA